MGAVERNVTVWLSRTGKDSTVLVGDHSALPDCEYVKTQFPAPTKATIPLVMEQMPVADGSTTIVTGRLVVDVPMGVYVAPPTIAVVGVGPTTVIVCVPGTIVKEP